MIVGIGPVLVYWAVPGIGVVTDRCPVCSHLHAFGGLGTDGDGDAHYWCLRGPAGVDNPVLVDAQLISGPVPDDLAAAIAIEGTIP